jgi:hypothetical protein
MSGQCWGARGIELLKQFAQFRWRFKLWDVTDTCEFVMVCVIDAPGDPLDSGTISVIDQYAVAGAEDKHCGASDLTQIDWIVIFV